MRRKLVAGLVVLVSVATGVWLVVSRSDHPAASEARPPSRSAALAGAPSAPKPAAPGPAPRGLAPRWSLDPDAQGPLRLEGQVQGPDGRGVAGAEVWLDSVPARTVKADDDGSFSFEQLVGRTYALSARRGELLGGPVRYKLTEHSDPVVIRIGEAAAILVTVVDDAKHPVNDAEVKAGALGGRTVRTGEQGTAKLSPLHPGWMTVEAIASGYAPARAFTTVGSAGAVGELTITLHRGFAVSGRVLDEAGTPIARARVSAAEDLMGIARDPESGAATTDDNGRFTIPALASGSHTLRAIDGEHAPARSPPVTISDKPVGNVEIVMKAGGVLAGTVVDATHKPVPFATVRVVGANQQIWQDTSRQTTTAQTGAFELRGLPRTKLSARAESDTAASKIAEADLSRTAKLSDLELVLDVAGTISGIVVDDTGAPVPEVGVNAFPDLFGGAQTEGLALAGLSSAVTGGAGEFVIRGLPDGAYRLWAARRSGGLDQWGQQGTSAKTGDKDVRITLAAPGQLTGKLALAGAGAPPRLATVALGFAAPTPASGGVFQLKEVTPGTYDVTFRGPEFAELIKHDVKIEPGKTTDLGTITVSRGRRLAGRVIDRSGAPVAGAKIRLGRVLFSLPDAGDQSDGIESMSGIRSTVSDQDGMFSIAGVPETASNVMADHPDRGRSLAIAIPEGDADPPEVSLALRGFGSITGKITRKGQPVAGVTVGESSKGGGAQGQFTRSAGDGTFTLAKVPEGAHVINAMQQALMSMRSTSVTVQVTAGHETIANIDIPVGELTVTVTIKPLPGSKLDAAQVFMFAGTVQIANGRQLLDGIFQSSLQGSKIWFGAGKPAPEFTELAAGTYSICALPITGDMADMQFQHRLQENMPSLKVYCKAAQVAPSPVSQSFALELPAMTPLPAPAQ
ncbi:MAG TPA: carboxypeptidase regulatory-like domain-containing protein [Kofleriaceae bacterium]|nr:carboxypeptidase regulatory-like domain-containing protein [Kofleriaceae bacterium]